MAQLAARAVTLSLLAACCPGAPLAPGQEVPPADAAPAWELETLRGVESLPASDVGALRILPGIGGSPGECQVGARKWPLDEVLFLRAPLSAAASREVVLLLRDGSELRGRVLPPAPGKDADDSVTLDSPLLGQNPVVVPLDAVEALVPCGPGVPGGEPAVLDTLQAARTLRSKKDVALLPSDSQLEGVLDSLDAEGIVFSAETAGKGLKIPYSRLRAVVLAVLDEETTVAEPSGVRLRAVLGDGTVLPVQLQRLEGGVLRLASRSLGKLEIQSAAVRELALLSGRVSYLSDREPLRVKEVLGAAFRSAAELRLGHKRDRNVLGGPLRLGDREHRKGLGVHSYSLLEYELDGAFQRFQAVIGLDRCAQPPAGATGTEARVVFRVLLDGKPALDKPLSWQDKPVAIDIQLGTARLIALEVDYGEATDPRSFLNAALDRADWADARFVK